MDVYPRLELPTKLKRPDETESGRYSGGRFRQNHFCLAITLSLIFA
jgi:hypothetical protein